MDEASSGTLARRAPRDCRRVDAARVECATLPRMSRRPPARLTRALAVGLLAAGIAGLLVATGTLAGFERDALDERYQCAALTRRPTSSWWGSTRTPSPRTRSRSAAACTRVRSTRCWPPARERSRTTSSSPPARATRRRRGACFARPPIRASCWAQPRYTPRPAPGRARRRAGCSRHGGRIGTVLMPVDDDGVWRRMEARVQGLPPSRSWPRAATRDAGEHPIDFAGPSGHDPRDPVPRRARWPLRPRAAVRGRIVVVGATALTSTTATPRRPAAA